MHLQLFELASYIETLGSKFHHKLNLIHIKLINKDISKNIIKKEVHYVCL